MKRRRGEVSLFEILRDPGESAELHESTIIHDSAEDRSVVDGAEDPLGTGEGQLGSSRLQGIDPASSEDMPNRVTGSSTPAPQASGKPRIDVTPSPRSSRRLAPLPSELSSGLDDVEPTLRGEAGWWDQTIGMKPPVLVIAGLGVILLGWLSFQMGISQAEKEQERLSAFGGPADSPSWSSTPLLHGPGGSQPEIRNVVNSGQGSQASGEETVHRLAGGPTRLSVIIVASQLGSPDNPMYVKGVEELVRYVEDFGFGEGRVHPTILGGQLAVFVGPFDSVSEAEEMLPQIHRIKPRKGTKFVDAYLRTLEFTPAEMELMRL